MSVVRGVRQTLPAGTVVGRGTGAGAPEAVPLAKLATGLATCANPLATSANASAAVAIERARAEAAEATLTSHLTAEVTRAEAAEATLTSGVAAEVTRAEAAEALKAPIAAPVFTGVAPTFALFGTYATDLLAAASGIAVGQLYWSGTAVVQRRA